MKREEFALSSLINATSPCNTGRNQKRTSEERAVPLSGVRPSAEETVVDLGYKRNVSSGEQHF